MEPAGWLMLVVSWSTIGGVATWCIWKVLRS
jgi:hypothetical protein